MQLTQTTINQFATTILTWYHQHGRKNLPWQQNKTCYSVWLSEIMLQQTQVKTVIPYFERFMQIYPTLSKLAAAPLDEVLHLWSGLGYYARARNLHRAAKIIMRDYQGIFPTDFSQVIALPGIGRSTAGSILTFAAQQSLPILDGNVKRVLCRYYTITGHPSIKQVENKLWQLSEQLTPSQHTAEFNQAMMDIGSLICSRNSPKCPVCPLKSSCLAYTTQECKNYPTKKMKMNLPQQERFFLILRYKNDVLLLRQPESGIWGGLYVFPQFALGSERDAWLKQQRLASHHHKSLPILQHTFSHFQLMIQSQIIELTQKKIDNKQLHQEYIWYNLANPPTIGLAAPIKKLLNHLYDISNLK